MNNTKGTTEDQLKAGGWVEHVRGCSPVADGIVVDVMWSNGDIDKGSKAVGWRWLQTTHAYGNNITHWRLHKAATKEEPRLNAHPAYKPAWGIDAAFDTPKNVNGYDELHTEDKEMYKYPKTNYIPPSDASLQATAKLKGLYPVICSFNIMTGKNLVEEDVELLEDLMSLFKNYKENV